MADNHLKHITLLYEKSDSDDTGPYIARKYRILYGSLDPKLVVKRLETCNFDIIGVEHEKKCIVCENKSVHRKVEKRIRKTLASIDKDIEQASKAEKDV